MRGEYRAEERLGLMVPELPPRARRIRDVCGGTVHLMGTTSACAENTQMVKAQKLLVRNYLRVRGEYWQLDARWEDQTELPPRARRIH